MRSKCAEVSFVLMDNWFSSEENFRFIISQRQGLHRCPQDNQLVALSLELEGKAFSCA